MKSRNNFVSVHTSVQYSRNNYILLPENIPTCMFGSIDKLISINMELYNDIGKTKTCSRLRHNMNISKHIVNP